MTKLLYILAICLIPIISEGQQYVHFAATYNGSPISQIDNEIAEIEKFSFYISEVKLITKQESIASDEFYLIDLLLEEESLIL